MAAIVPARLELRNDVPWSSQFGDLYHSGQGGLTQAEHVFLQGNGLPQRWAGRRSFTVLETGFGLGLNFLATWRAWRRDAQRCGRLHYVAVEKHPFSVSDLRLAHGDHPQVREEAAELHAAWPPLVSGAHRLEFGNVVLTLFFGDVAVLRELRLAADAIYLDGFAPAKNPEMWTHAVMRSISRLAGRDAMLATWSVASGVRDALASAGFEVERRPGFGEKWEMLAARNRRSVPDTDLPARKAVVVGAGLAGAAVCERLCARGWEVELHERRAEPAQEASGNHAGAFHPIVTSDDSVFARLTRAAYLYSTHNWQRLNPLRWDRCGVLQLARSDKEWSSQQSAVKGLPDAYVELVSREEAARHAGVPVASAGLWFPGSGWIKPRSLVRAQLDACGPLLTRRFSSPLEQPPDGKIVVLANSAEAPKLCTVPHLRLRTVRGQLTYVPADAFEPPHAVVLRGGMVLPPIDGVCVVGASYDIGDEDRALRDDSHEGNLDRLQGILGIRPPLENLAGRVAFRSVTPDRLPVVGRIGDNVYGAFAFGSRGLLWAALAAEIIACELEGEPLPVERQLLESLSPARFARRAGSRGSRP